jgi:chorismate lyase / 3-hydroxybenzoate synthase
MSASSSALRVRRLSAATPPNDTSSMAASHWLGCLGLGHAALPPDQPGLALALPRLAPSMPSVDALIVDAPVQTGQTGQRGRVQWRAGGGWVFGWLSIDGGDDTPLDVLAHGLYGDVFAALAEADCPHLLRAWNYLPHINADSRSLERYRRFNVGRQQAFIDAGRNAFAGAPAACALGSSPNGPLALAFLGGRHAPTPVENPRQVPAYHYPAEYGPRSPTFSRAVICDAGEGANLLAISGTASIVGHETRHQGDVVEQTNETLRNLHALLAAADASDASKGQPPWLLDALHLTAYVRRADDAPAVYATLAQALGTRSPALRGLTMLQADVCRSELLVEIEAHGCR